MTDVAAQLRNEIATINKVFAAFGVQAMTQPASTMVAGHSFVAYGLKLGATQRISDVQRLLPELSERLAALAAQPVLWPGDVEEMERVARALGLRVWLRRIDLASGEVSVRSVG